MYWHSVLRWSCTITHQSRLATLNFLVVAWLKNVCSFRNLLCETDCGWTLLPSRVLERGRTAAADGGSFVLLPHVLKDELDAVIKV